MAEVLIDILAQNLLKLCGSFVDHSTVILGSGAGPRLLSVFRYLNEVFVTIGTPSIETPPIDSVTHVGSPEKSWLYSGVLANFTSLSFIMKWSTSS